MTPEFDVLIVGAGMFGSSCAYELTKKGFKCLVIDKRDHIGGNCYTEFKDGIHIHKYGPHIFHTSSKCIWDWINQFAEFNHFRYHGRVNYGGNIYSFPINMMTFHQLFGVITPDEAEETIAKLRTQAPHDNIENYAISQIGVKLYEIFIKGYTEKQWGVSAAELPASILRRIPIRFTYDDNYYDDAYQGIPTSGYAAMFDRMLAGIQVRLNTDYFSDRNKFDFMARSVVFTGRIDRFFDYRFGVLKYRSVKMEHEFTDVRDYQGAAIVNYTSPTVPYTRIIEHKHFAFGTQRHSWISREYPGPCTESSEPAYPVRDSEGVKMFHEYYTLSQKPQYSRYHFGGRLAQFQYFDMHQVISAAINKAAMIVEQLHASA